MLFTTMCNFRFLHITFLLVVRAFAQAPAGNATPALQVLSQQGPSLSSWVLAPIDRSIPDAIRQNLTFMREGLVDEGKARPQASLEAYRVAYQLCSSLIAALDEREKMLLKAGYRAVQANVVTPATNQALEARRNYLMIWPQYEREVQQRNDLLRVGEAADRRKVELALQDLKLEWAKRTEPLRTSLDALYVKLRAALRDSGVTTKTFDGAQGGSKGNVPAMPVTATTSVSPQGTFTNSLGMKFVPVPGTQVMMCIHETRNADYAAYASSQSGVDEKWSAKAGGGREQHPVVMVDYGQADAFCRWLSAKEGKTYRLPTDAEWSVAVGLGKETGKTPVEKDQNGPEDLFPWGRYYPPKIGDGNYEKVLVDDGYDGTAPVMSFRANELGIYDLGGNVWEWCQDWYDSSREDHVMRGGAFFTNDPRVRLRSSCRYNGGIPSSYRYGYYGFRCVLVVHDNKTLESSTDPPANVPARPGPTGVTPPTLMPPNATVAKVRPNSPNGYDLGAVGSGGRLTLQYVTGRWKSYGTYATANPDSLELERGDKTTENMCVIAEPADSEGIPGSIIAVVPPKTETTPFQFTADKDYPKLVLRILANSHRKENLGEVIYMLGRSRDSSIARQPNVAPAKTSPPSWSAQRADSRPGSFVNTLGMQFVPVPETTVMICIHETRNADYAAYAASEKTLSNKWRNGTASGEQHPVTNVDYEDAEGFCRWLSKKEGKNYRLPTDSEWSAAVGLGREEGDSPRQKADRGPDNVYPWGNYWPPKPEDGNYGFMMIDDGHITTALVMSFRPNALGIYDLGGNVSERCIDGPGSSSKFRLLRGASWAAYDRVGLCSKSREVSEHTKQRDVVGFRCVVEVDGG